jgi:hypothetical protein
MKHLLPILFLVLTFSSIVAQTSYNNEVIDLIQLDLVPTKRGPSTLRIEHNPEGKQFRFTCFNFKYEVLSTQVCTIPDSLYQNFEALVVKLDVASLEDLYHLYLIDGLSTEVTYINNEGSMNKFETRVPAVRGPNITLIEAIIELGNQLPLLPEHAGYFRYLYDDYLVYCRK